MGLFDFASRRRLSKIKEMKYDQVKKEEDYLERVLVISKEADMNDLRKNTFNVHVRRFQLKTQQGLLNEHLQDGRAYRLQVELKPDEVKRIKQNKETELTLHMDEESTQAKYFIRGKILTEPLRQKGKDYSITVVDCGINIHTRVGVTYKKGEWIEALGSIYLTAEQITKIADNTVLIKEIETGIKTESGLHLLAVDSHKNLYLTADVHGNNEYLMFKINYSGETYNEVDDDMVIPKGSYLSNEDLRKAPKEIMDSLGKFDSFAYDEEYVFVCDGTSAVKVLKHNGKLDAIKTTNNLYFKDYIAEKFNVPKESVK